MGKCLSGSKLKLNPVTIQNIFISFTYGARSVAYKKTRRNTLIKYR